ncbi:MAG: hypothetical protein O7G83_15655, partial [Proteobacteria bacterium]|nr:hypothetical protein [Pseudomonadota bacterium]
MYNGVFAEGLLIGPVAGGVMGTRREVIAALDLVARGDVWSMVTDIRPLEEAEALHQRVEEDLVTGDALRSCSADPAGA